MLSDKGTIYVCRSIREYWTGIK